MSRNIVGCAIVLMLCLVSFTAEAAQRGRGGGRPEGGRGEPQRSPNTAGRNQGSFGASNSRAPGGNWSERSMGNQGRNQFGSTPNTANRANPGAGGANNRLQPQNPGLQNGAGAGAANRNQSERTGAQDAAAGAAVANRNQPQYSGAEGALAGSAAVRNNYEHNGVYGQDWYGAHAAAWAPTAWVAGSAWTPSTYGAVAGYCSYPATPAVSYNYGSNVTCTGGNVAVNGQPVGTAEEFSQQADALAQSGAAAQPAATDKWMPLGVFALVRDETQHPHLIMQMAINQQGILRGNYTDEVTDNTQPIQGAVDPKTQRAAWTVGDNKTSVMEAGLANLTQGEAPALIHKNGKTDRWLLVRLDQANQAAGGAAPSAGPK